MLDLLKNARVRMAALLTLLGASGVVLAVSQDSCTVKLSDAADAGVVEDAAPAEPAESVEPTVNETVVTPAEGQ
jgi:hypothetical protein